MKVIIAQGFTLVEVMVSLVLSSVVVLGAAKLLPQLIAQRQAIEQRQYLRQEVDQLLMILEKAIRRAGYCFGDHCVGPGLVIAQGPCLLLRWDDNHNGRWEGPNLSNSDYFAFRYRSPAIETKRGTADCGSRQWSRINEPQRLRITDFRLKQLGRWVEITLSAQSGKYRLQRTHRVQRENS